MRRLDATLGLVAAAAVAGPTLVVTHPPRIARHAVITGRLLPRHVVPQAELPAVEPVAFVDMSPDEARAYNAEVPFSSAPNPPAVPYRMIGADDAKVRATDCLAAAVVYEAGDDAEGERAVAQVVLNRLRHPAFPKTVCGVVFQGQERSTGCQFTFTCDGALTRWHPSNAAWRRARDVATRALAGSVYRPIGYATHYHTEWVVPYWQSSLDKVAAVHTHLFFRWSGWWGTPPAFRRAVSHEEPVIADLALLSEAHRTGAEMTDAQPGTAVEDDDLPLPLDDSPDSFLLLLPAGQAAESYRTLALRACGIRLHCQVMGWTDPAAVPAALPLAPEQMATMAFSYLRDRKTGFEKALWNCSLFRRMASGECMKRPLAGLQPAIAAPVAPAVKPNDPATGLGGVRRRSATRDASEPLTTNGASPAGDAPGRGALTPPQTSLVRAP